MGMPGLASTDRIRSMGRSHINAPSMSRNIDLYDVDFFKIVQLRNILCMFLGGGQQYALSIGLCPHDIGKCSKGELNNRQ